MLNQKFAAPRAKAAGKKTKPAGLAKTEVELEIALHYLKPRIWRSFVVPGSITLHRLHDVIQVVMGWTDSHLHSFRFGDGEYGVPDDDCVFDSGATETEVRDERKHVLSDLIKSKDDEFNYTYDFGDSWEHTLRVKAIRPADEALKAAICTGGARACPPEDCGSFPGYEELLKVLRNPKHPEHESMREWAGDYDPARFNLADVNRQLKRIRVERDLVGSFALRLMPRRR